MTLVTDWSEFPSFSKDEFDCKQTGKNKMEHDFMCKLQYLRDVVDEPFIISSGYRAAEHSIEAAKDQPGEHYYGRAADIKCSHKLAKKILDHAGLCGFTRIGVSQKGDNRYLHLGTSTEEQGFVSPHVWSY